MGQVHLFDLGFLNAIESMQHQVGPPNLDKQTQAMNKLFEELSTETLENVFLALQQAMKCIIEVDGVNNYKLPHMNKAVLRAQNGLPESITYDEVAIKESQCTLNLLKEFNK